MRTLLLILSALALSACSEPASSPPGGLPAPTPTPAPAPSPAPAPAPTPTPTPPPAVDPAACHAQLHWQGQYGQPNRTIITLGPACRGSQQVQIGLFASAQAQYPEARTGDTLWVNQHEVQGYAGYIVKARLKLAEGQYTPWYNDAHGALLNDGSGVNTLR